MKRNKKNKLIIGLTTLILTTSGLFVTTTFTDNVVKAENPEGYNKVLPDNTQVIGGVYYKKGTPAEDVWRDLGFRGYTPFNHKMVPQTPFSTPRARAAV